MNGARKQLLYKPVLLMIKLLLSSYISCTIKIKLIKNDLEAQLGKPVYR